MAINSSRFLKRVNMKKNIIENKDITLKDKKKYAKVGMTVSLGVLTATGFMRVKGTRGLHIWSGAALIGFSLWHHMLYQSKN